MAGALWFDPHRATLVASPADLDALAALAAGTLPPEDEWARWREAGLVVAGALDPTVAGIVELLARPTRSLLLERFSAGRVEISFVVWDRAGRAAMADGAGPDLLAVTATDMALLPGLLVQAVRLNPRTAAAVGPVHETTAGAVEAILRQPTGGSGPSGAARAGEPPGAEPSPGLAAVLGPIRHAWRISGSWHGHGTDRSLTVFSAGDQGLWTVEHGASAPGSTPGPATPVRLTPVSARHLIERLGDVVTGRTPNTDRSAVGRAT